MTRLTLATLAVLLTGSALAGPAVAAPAASPSATPTPAPRRAPPAGPPPLQGPNGQTVAPYVPNLEPIPVPTPASVPPPPYVPADVPERPLTVDEAVLLALRHQPNVDIAAANIEVAQGRTQQVQAGLNPSVTASFSYTGVSTQIAGNRGGGGGGGANNFNTGAANASANGTTTQQVVIQQIPAPAAAGSGGSSGSSLGTGSNLSNAGGGGGGFNGTTGLSSNVTIRQLVFDFEHTRDLVRQSVAQETAAQASFTQVQADLVLQVKQAFYTYVQDQRLVDVQATNIKNQQEHLRLAQGLYNAGTGLPADVVRAQAAVADAINSYIQAVNTADTARIALVKLMGIDPRTPLVTAPSNEPAIDDTDIAGLEALALQLRPEVRQALAVVEANQYGLSAAHTTNAPALTASATVSSIPIGSNQIEILSAGLDVSWPFVDGGVTRGLVTQAKGNLQIALDQLRLARTSIIQDVSTSYLNVHSALQQLATTGVEVASAQENLRLQSGRYAAGLGTSIDVLDAEQALLQALTNQVNAQSSVDNARAALTHAIGTPPPSFGAPLPPTSPLILGTPDAMRPPAARGVPPPAPAGSPAPPSTGTPPSPR